MEVLIKLCVCDMLYLRCFVLVFSFGKILSKEFIQIITTKSKFIDAVLSDNLLATIIG